MNKEQAVEIIERHIDNIVASGSLVEQALRMAIDALKAQLSQEGTTSDTISRQQAIDVIEDYPHGNVWNVESMEEMVDKIKALPSAQPKHDENPRQEQGDSDKLGVKTGETCEDCISRQEAIDAVHESYDGILDFKSTGQTIAMSIEDILTELPPVQPVATDTNVGDTISRQQAIDICNGAIDIWHGQLGEGALVAVRNKISELPAAQSERKKGKWLNINESEKWECSECGRMMWFSSRLDVKPSDYRFCPNCGAKMEETGWVI